MTSRPTRSAGGSGASGCSSHGGRLKITEERLDQVEGFFEKRRRDHDPRRPLPRLRAPAGAVHRRRVAACRCAASCPTTCSPRACGRSRSARSATSSGARSTSSRPTSARGLFAFGTLVVVIARDRRARAPAPQPRGARARVRDFLDARQDQRGWRTRRPARPAGAGGSSGVDAARALGRVDPGRPRPRAHDAARAARRRPFCFFGLGERRSRTPASPGIDRAAADLAERLRMDALVNVAKVVTDLGSLPRHRGAHAGHRRLRGRPQARDRRRRARARLAARLRRRPRRQGRLRPPAPARQPRRDHATPPTPRATRPTRSP